MDFKLTEEQVALRTAARDYVQKRLPALAAEIERTGEPPSHELIHEYAQMGFLGINVPTEYGGLGLGNIEALIVLEEFGVEWVRLSVNKPGAIRHSKDVGVAVLRTRADLPKK